MTSLRAQRVPQWTELPLWRPYPGTWRVDAAHARAPVDLRGLFGHHA
ncbi:hypothetical protein AB0M95_05010 [Sphaerisporangium sp. NPDC051017]